MDILKQSIYNRYALWIGDNINKTLDIPTKQELAAKIYESFSDDIKAKVGEDKNLTEISQLFLDSATGNMTNLMSLLESDLRYEGHGHPYSHLSKIDVIDTIITHDHSNILETIWDKGVTHNIFEEKYPVKPGVNLFKILGDYTHPEKIVLTSQNMRKVKKLKLYDHFWNKLNIELSDKNLILLGVTLDEDTKDLLNLVFSKLTDLTPSKFFVTSNSLSLEDEEWLISKGFEFIYEDDENFIKKIYLYLKGEEIEDVAIDASTLLSNQLEDEQKNVEVIHELPHEEIHEKVEEQLTIDNVEVIHELPKEEPKEDVAIDNEKSEEEPIIKEYIVENLDIPVYLEGTTLKCEIIETETQNRSRRLTEFRESQYPSYKIDDFSEINHYKALDIKIPFENTELPVFKVDKKIFSGKVDIKCNDQKIYGVSIKSNMSEKYQIIEFKNHDFHLTLILVDDKVINFHYKISENTVNIKGKNIYIFFKNLFSGLELNFKNKKISGHFKVESADEIDKLNIIIDAIEKFLTVKKHIKIKEISLKELLKNTRSLEVLYSYYTDTPKVISGNITIRTNFNENIDTLDKLILSYPIGVNFLGIKKTFIESTEINLDNSEITLEEGKLEVQALNTIQKITYQESK